MNCPRCGVLNHPQARFCQHCGQGLQPGTQPSSEPARLARVDPLGILSLLACVLAGIFAPLTFGVLAIALAAVSLAHGKGEKVTGALGLVIGAAWCVWRLSGGHPFVGPPWFF